LAPGGWDIYKIWSGLENHAGGLALFGAMALTTTSVTAVDAFDAVFLEANAVSFLFRFLLTVLVRFLFARIDIFAVVSPVQGSHG